MNYYQHHIGDYRRDTAHLTLLEHGIYRQMLDQYYLSERPICVDDAKLLRSLCARNADEMQAVKRVLTDFFVLTDSGYIHKRCDVEIEAFHGKSKSASESAKARWERVRAEKEAKSCERIPDALPTDCESNANHKPLTTNQKPLKEKAKAPPTALPDLFDGVSPQVVTDFKVLRKSKKLPITQTAIDGIQREADKARVTLEAALTMCCERGWAGFKAEWLAAPAARASPAHGYQTANEKTKSWCDELLGVTQNDQRNEFIDITPTPGFLD